jgi:NAD(P)-dependent dehydrogenase (short-subunit alcohol dehydrogenase family)
VSLQNRVALVTGAARGIGKEIALTLAKSGARLAVSYRTNKRDAQKVLGELKAARGDAAGPENLAVATDVTDSRRVKELVEAVVRHFGRLDILVNNVGEFEWKAVIDSSIAEWHSLLASNLFSVFYTSKYVLPTMRAQRWGRIINLGSVGAERGFGQAKISAYSAAKSGMIAFSRSLALEEARHGITVNVVNPPIMDDKDLSLEEALRIADARFPAGRPPSVQDVAQAVKFFASEASSFITGQVLTVSGGWML